MPNVPVLEVAPKFYNQIFYHEQGVEPLLICDPLSELGPGRIFLVRFVIGEGAGGEVRRPIFRNELTAYDYRNRLTYPLQDTRLERLQSTIESGMYAQAEGVNVRVKVRNVSTSESHEVRALISSDVVKELLGIYEFAW